MAILLDTHAIVWLGTNDRRLGRHIIAAVGDAREPLCVSAVTAYEFADLNRRGRFGADFPLGDLVARLDATILDYPAAAWRIAADLPPFHLDPVDRMLVAHAMYADMVIATTDALMRRYPVRTIW